MTRNGFLIEMRTSQDACLLSGIRSAAVSVGMESSPDVPDDFSLPRVGSVLDSSVCDNSLLELSDLPPPSTPELASSVGLASACLSPTLSSDAASLRGV